MNVIVCVGGLISSSGSFLYGLDFIYAGEMEINSVICQAKNWLLVSSFTVIVGPIFAKTWRVHRIFKHATKGSMIITDQRLLMLLGLALIVDAIILTAWQVFDPLLYRSVEVNLTIQTKPNGNETTSTSFIVYECRSTYGAIWLCVVLVWKWLLLTVGLYLAWQTREISIPQMNDSTTTTANIFLTVSLFCVTGMVISYLQALPDAKVIVSIVCVSAYTVVIQMLHFCPKVYFWWKKPDNVQMRVSISSFANRVEFLSHEKGNNILTIIKENNSLKESLSEKEEVISELQHHLNDAKEKLVQLYAEVELKQDSGFEFDISSISTLEDNSTVSLPQMNGFISHPSVAFRQFAINKDNNHFGGDTNMEDITNNRPDLRTRIERYMVSGPERHDMGRNSTMKRSVSIRSAISLISLAEISHLRDSIAEDLEQAQVLSRHLSQKYASLPSIHNLTEEWVLDSDTSNDELTSSIAKSYNMDENQETLAYIKSFVQKGHNLRQVQRSQNQGNYAGQTELLKEPETGGTSEICQSDSEIEITRLPTMGIKARNFRDWSRKAKLSDIRSRPRNRVSRHSSSRSSSGSSQRSRPIVRQLSDSFAQGSFRSLRRPLGQLTRAPHNGEFDRLFPDLCSTSEESPASSLCNIGDSQTSQQLADLDRILISTVEDTYESSSSKDHAHDKFYYSDTSSNCSEMQTNSMETLISNRMMMHSEHALTNLYVSSGAYNIDSFV
ncbi:hypothetical protein CHS0354_038599 [Potamilus streckersoni]|uniref:G-protein coupled receptors family 3 profile domain-containing protein n=1 Tax=Potamilus streckersoni TaxID=2493646 RepID=A0AAE0WDQ5_9BIVA|nr:hypothetical protein CHS0354_038599 [Potamilus streckersoni]